MDRGVPLRSGDTVALRALSLVAGRLVPIIAVVAFLLGITGCKTATVADDLAQREANEIVSVLREKGIEAQTEKERGGRGRYAVSVASGRFGEAASILTEKGLPSERRATFNDLVSQGGILPSSREVEALRLDRAIASEIEDLLRGHPSVSTANAVVRYRSLEGASAPSVSLVIQKRPGTTGLQPFDVRTIVARAVPGVKADDIVLSIAEQPGPAPSSTALKGEEALIPFLGFWQVPANEYNSLAVSMIGLLLLVAMMAGLAGYIYGQYILSGDAEVGSYDHLEGGPSVAQLNPPTRSESGDEL